MSVRNGKRRPLIRRHNYCQSPYARHKRVKRGRPSRQGDKTSLWREAEHLIIEQLKFRIFHELFSRFAGLQLLDHILQPGMAQACGHRARPHLLLYIPNVPPRRFGDLVHLLSAYLNFHPLIIRPDNRGVERLIAIELGR